MFKRGGFASYTKTGRGISMGRALGEGLARGGTKNNEPSFCAVVIMILLILILLNKISQITKHNIQ
jgi:hypothetical protein